MAVPGVGPPRGTQAARRRHADRPAYEARLQAGSLRLEARGDIHGEERGKEAKTLSLFLLLTSHVLTLQILSTLCASLTSQAWMLRHQNPLFTGDEDAQWPSALRGPGVTGELPQRSKVAFGSAGSARGRQASVFSKRRIKFSQTASSRSKVPGPVSSFRICFLRA